MKRGWRSRTCIAFSRLRYAFTSREKPTLSRCPSPELARERACEVLGFAGWRRLRAKDKALENAAEAAFSALLHPHFREDRGDLQSFHQGIRHPLQWPGGAGASVPPQQPGVRLWQQPPSGGFYIISISNPGCFLGKQETMVLLQQQR